MTVCRCGYEPSSALDWVLHCKKCPCATLAAQTPARGFTERVREKRLTQNQDLIEGATPRQRPSQLCVREPDFVQIDRRGFLQVEGTPNTASKTAAPALREPRPALETAQPNSTTRRAE
jgi:hypothetical protein